MKFSVLIGLSLRRGARFFLAWGLLLAILSGPFSPTAESVGPSLFPQQACHRGCDRGFSAASQQQALTMGLAFFRKPLDRFPSIRRHASRAALTATLPRLGNSARDPSLLFLESHPEYPRLVREFGEEGAKIVMEETRQSLRRLMGDASPSEMKKREDELLKKTQALTLGRVATTYIQRYWMTPTILFLLSLVPMSYLYYQSGFTEPEILTPSWIMLFAIGFSYSRKIYLICSRAIGLHSKSALLIKRRSRHPMTGIVAHEIAHDFFTIESHVAEGFATLRMMESGTLPEAVVKIFYKPQLEWIQNTPLEQLQKKLAQWAKNLFRADWNTTEPLWSYAYGRGIAFAAYYLSDRNLDKAFQVINLMGRENLSFVEAMRKVNGDIPFPPPPPQKGAPGEGSPPGGTTVAPPFSGHSGIPPNRPIHPLTRLRSAA